jgi:hypothetical protein
LRRPAGDRARVVVALAAASALAVCALTDAACLFPAYSVGDVGGGDVASGASSATRGTMSHGPTSASGAGGDASTSSTGTNRGGGQQTSATGTSVGAGEPVGGAGGGSCAPMASGVEPVECGLPQPVGISAGNGFLRWGDLVDGRFYDTPTSSPGHPLQLAPAAMPCATVPVGGGFGRAAAGVVQLAPVNALAPATTGSCMLASNSNTAFWLSTDGNGTATHLFKYSNTDSGSTAPRLDFTNVVTPPPTTNAPVAMAADDAHVYWADSANAKIYYTLTDGTGLQFFAQSALGLFALGGSVYYVDASSIGVGEAGSTTTMITTTNAAPTGPLVLVTTGTGTTDMFWATATGISTRDLGLVQAETVVAAAPQGVQSMATDGTYVYWISGHDIWRYPVP